jgi:hypothetical protein
MHNLWLVALIILQLQLFHEESGLDLGTFLHLKVINWDVLVHVTIYTAL